MTGQQIYQYRLILPFDDGKLLNVASNIDFSSVEGEVKVPINANINSKASFVVRIIVSCSSCAECFQLVSRA
jgi:hypothetical protein